MFRSLAPSADFEGTLPSFWNIGNQPDELNIDVGNGSIPLAGTLAEDHEDSDERYGSMGIEQHVRYLVADGYRQMWTFFLVHM